MVRKLGANRSRAGTGTISDYATTENTEKWVGSIANQYSSNENIKDIAVKTIPLDLIKADQDNPRKLAITIALVTKIAKECPVKHLIKNEDDNDWIEFYVKNVTDEFKLQSKQVGDLTSIVEFASALRSPDRLLHPIVVWKDDATFHLISGERRVLAHIMLGVQFIEAKIVSNKPTTEEIDALQWDENVHRLDMTLYERVVRIEKFITHHFNSADKASVRKLSKLSGLAHAEAQRYLAIIRFPDQTLINAIKEGKITSLKQAAELAKASEQELKKLINQPKASTAQKEKSLIKISKNADSVAVKKIIDTVAKEFGIEQLLSDLDLSKQKNLTKAFNIVISHLAEEKQDGKN